MNETAIDHGAQVAVMRGPAGTVEIYPLDPVGNIVPAGIRYLEVGDDHIVAVTEPRLLELDYGYRGFAGRWHKFAPSLPGDCATAWGDLGQVDWDAAWMVRAGPAGVSAALLEVSECARCRVRQVNGHVPCVDPDCPHLRDRAERGRPVPPELLSPISGDLWGEPCYQRAEGG